MAVEVIVLRERGCPRCKCPTAAFAVYRSADRLYLMCDEVEECWWHPDRMSGDPDFWANTSEGVELAGAMEYATLADLERAGWDTTRFSAETWAY